MSLKLISKILIFAILLPGFAFSQVESCEKQKAEIVFCLDLSASTNGLLNDIRDNLWQFINNAKINYPQTNVRIGIVVFGRPSFSAENHYVKVLCDITEDYDLVSYYLFLLKANIEKGDQCVGSALFTSLKDLHWGTEATTKKMIFLFGNSNVKMCGYDYRKACETAANKTISIHAIHCSRGAISEKYLPMWNEIAELTGGDFYNYLITGRSQLKKFSNEAQYLSALNDNFLDTYIPYGRNSKLHYDLLVAADDNSKKMNEQVFIERCIYKFSDGYDEQCRKWDLVTFMKTNSSDFAKLDHHHLPEEYQNLTYNEIKEVVEIKIARRSFIKKQMQNILLNSSIDVNNNPIDSIFQAGLNKGLNFVVSKLGQR